MVCRRSVAVTLPTILMVAAGLFLTFFTFSSGCKPKINSKSVSLLATVRVSLADDGAEGLVEVAVERPDVSDDGRFVVFASKANLVPGIPDNNTASDIFLRDNVTRTTILVSQSPVTLETADGVSTQPTISGDGRYVVFASTAPDLSPEDNDSTQDIFVRDMQETVLADAIRLVSRPNGPNTNVFTGNKSNGSSNNPRISKDGRFVVFDTTATNLVGADASTDRDIYRRQINDPLNAFLTILVSRSTGNPGPKGTVGNSQFPSISEDGHLIAFISTCQDMVPNGADGGPKGGTTADVFVHNADSGRTIRVSIGLGLVDPNGASTSPMISGDGNFVVWQSGADNLNIADDSLISDIFVRDISDLTGFPTTGTIEIISVHSSGAQAGNGCANPIINRDGRLVVWDSPSTNLVNGDANNRRDIFMRDRQAAQTSRVSVATFGAELNADSQFPAISRDGRFVVFHSQATNAADDDTNGAGDFYLRGPPF